MYWKKVQKTPFFFELDAKNFNSPCNLIKTETKEVLLS